MKLMFEIDSANVEETRLVAKFLNEAAALAERQAQEKAPSINGDSNADIPLHPEREPLDVLAAAHTKGTLERIAAETHKGPNETGETTGLVAPSNVVQLHTPPAPPAPPGPPAAPMYDANGMPWDARIHAGNQAKTITGAWKYKRGVDDATKASVEASLPRGTPTVVTAETTAPTPPMPPLPPTPPAPPAPPAPPHASGLDPATVAHMSQPGPAWNPAPSGAGLPAQSAMPGAALPPPPSIPPTAPVEDEADLPGIDFATLMIKVSEAMGAGQLNHDAITAKIKPIGIDNLFTLSSRPDLVGQAAAALGF